MKLPVDFPSLIFCVLIKKKPDISSVEDVTGVNPCYLNFSYNLFFGNHIPDIVLSKIQNFDIRYLTIKGNLPEVSPTFGTTIAHVLQELIWLSKNW